MNDLAKEENVVDLMKSSKSVEEWNLNCDRVKEANQNDYPEFWFSAIIQSGVAALITGKVLLNK